MGFFDDVVNFVNPIKNPGIIFPGVTGPNALANLPGMGGASPANPFSPSARPAFNPDALIAGLPKIDPNSIYKPQTANFTIDPLLSPSALLGRMDAASKAAGASTTDIARGFVAPQIPLLESSVADSVSQARANAQSDFLRRGLTGSSTELYTLGRDIPAAGMKALSDAEVNLLTQAIPLAQNEKQLNFQAASKGAEFGVSLRKLIGDEEYNKLSLDQKDRITQADIALKVQLDAIDKNFQAHLEDARQAFQWASDESDRKVAADKYQAILDAQKQAKKQAFLKSGLTLAGAGVGATMGQPLVGAEVGGASADMFGFLTS